LFFPLASLLDPKHDKIYMWRAARLLATEHIGCLRGILEGGAAAEAAVVSAGSAVAVVEGEGGAGGGGGS